MESLNEITLLFATLISPAFIAYLIYRKLLNKSIYENMNIALVISLVAFNFIIIGFIKIIICILEIILQILFLIFSREISEAIIIILQSLIVIKLMITNKIYNKKSYILIFSLGILGLLGEMNLFKDLLDNTKFLIVLNDIKINPFSIVLNTVVGTILLLIIQKNFFNLEIPKTKQKIKECGYMYATKFLQENSIISKSFKEISLAKFPELRLNFAIGLEYSHYYKYELAFDSKYITQFFLNKEFSLLQFVMDIDQNNKEIYNIVKHLIKDVFYNKEKLRILIEYYAKDADTYYKIEPIVDDENIEIYVSEDNKFIINLKLCNKDILRYIR